MGPFQLASVVALAACISAAPAEVRAVKPKGFLKDLGNSTWVIGNGIWNMTQGRQYGTKLMYKGKDRVGPAVGHYMVRHPTSIWTSAAIEDSGRDWINIKFAAKEGDFHWVIHDDFAGAYQYFVNHALPTLGEFRTLWRLENSSFPNGHTNVKDGELPPLSEYASATNVQDETWQKADGTFLTKYDWSAFIREQTFYGVYGDEVGSWYINPGKDYYNGDHLKQELMIHRESKTGDAVQLNMIHGTHYLARSSDNFTDGKMWGPWLWYLNDGSKDDAAKRWKQEDKAWPYEWIKDAAYQSRGSVSGKLVLSDGRPASGAAVFLGDSNSALSTADQGKDYYYTTYADKQGSFTIKDVRTGTYGLYTWGNGGSIADVTTSFIKNDVVVSRRKTTGLGSLQWTVTEKSKRIFQIGDLDRKSVGFSLSGPTPFEHGRISETPANLTYTVGKSHTSDWYFGQSKLGTWTVNFDLKSILASATGAKLTASLAGFSSGTKANILVNDEKIGNISTNAVLLVSSQDTYRGATQAGEWRNLQFDVKKELLKEGLNTLDFAVIESTQWRGWLWDSVVLEWIYS
ncbi:hypothetical protein N0V90_004868 [Kalmusia sp. IMI 367209]|nr:hypothetical protein N0V90_004868 [Kalmusia sp. IMI 367209]